MVWLSLWAVLVVGAVGLRGAQVVTSDGGMVVSGSREASEIGVAILERGGSAMDAAVGVSLAVGVGEPDGSGLGGKLILLHRSAADGTVRAVVGLDSAPAAVTAAEARGAGRANLTRGWRAAAVAGMLPALAEAHERWGRLAWRECVEPVVGLAREGAVVTADLAALLRKYRETLGADGEFRRIFFPEARVPVVGSRLPQLDLAASLELVAERGADAMRDGVIVERIAAASKAGGGWLRGSDLADVEPEIAEPLRIEWRDWQVWSSPVPSTGGMTVLLALQALESAGTIRWDAVGIVRVCAVLRQVYPLARGVATGDAGVELLAGAEAESVAARVAEGIVDTPEVADSDEGVEGSTTHFVVVDAAGNVVSATQSLGFKFGAGVIAPGTGVILNNSMGNFAVNTENSPNYLRPGLRARTTMSPVIAVDPDGGCLALGAPGGSRIPTAVLEVLVGVTAGGLSLEDAVDAPRFHLRPRILRGDPANLVDVEDGFGLAGDLREAGWEVDFRAADEFYFGGVNAAWRGADGVTRGVADGRRSNYAKPQTEQIGQE